jgi:PEP-CTERM motif
MARTFDISLRRLAMIHRQRFATHVTSGFLLAVLAATDASAAVYTGNVQTSFKDPIGGTTDAPASYQTAVGQETAVSTTSAATGGSAFVRATSFSLVATASAIIDYTIRLVGPAGNAVPVDILASGYADGAGYYNASSSITVLQGTQVVAALGEISPWLTPTYTPGRFDFTLDQTLQLEPNVDYRIYMTASASSGNRTPFASFAEAYIDPVFTIDPAFVSLYTLTGVPAVPEPASWALMLAGAGLIAASPLRQRRETWQRPALALPVGDHHGR